KPGNFPGITNIRYDNNSNILGKNGNLLLYKYSNYINSKKQFTLKSSEYFFDSEKNMIIKKKKRLNFYETQVNGATDYSIEFKPMYVMSGGTFYIIENGVLLIPQSYKSLDVNGNLVIDSSFFNDPNYSEYFTFKNGKSIVNDTGYLMNSKVRQPQSAMTIFDYKNGEIKAMIGGRDVKGRRLFNRAVSPRQPGSSIKPLAVYGPALEIGADAAAKDTPIKYKITDTNIRPKAYGPYFTASSGINDRPITVSPTDSTPIRINGVTWPQNFEKTNFGMMTMRKAVQMSNNVSAVRVWEQVGAKRSASYVKKFGITTLVEKADGGDLNPAALALGGLTQGVTTLEMSAAFGAFPNKGYLSSPITYTKIEDKNGKVLLENTSEKEKVIDPGVAFVMTDILKSAVTSGTGIGANLYDRPVGGKTGTTSDNYDAWFCGFTPEYSAAVWIGNDVNLELTTGSDASANLFRIIMSTAAPKKPSRFPKAPSNVVAAYPAGYMEYYVNGSQSGAKPVIDEQKKKEEEAKRKKEEEARRKKEEEKRKKEEQDKNKDPSVTPIIRKNIYSFFNRFNM
ncbi:MAG: transglycosylase domain-containing protein, partial [Anaerovoracaceae bacterium]